MHSGGSASVKRAGRPASRDRQMLGATFQLTGRALCDATSRDVSLADRSVECIDVGVVHRHGDALEHVGTDDLIDGETLTS